MLNILVLCVGTLKEQYLRDAIKEYSKRINGYAKLTIVETANDRELIPKLPKKAYKIALCIEGKELSSEELSLKICDTALRGISDIVFVIGDSDGMGEDVKGACDFRLSFSKMTFPHQLMRVILLEQIYRALSIANNGKYHK
ncbi:MAG: 23S rRNA (pseudouridine(1915)-N(3))-methyltransferase RlmH [Clostridia bacterium]|nr:23S rRNA (pseudouridine(1915)-N(3))-methyltransferase RlmH [Clostridia bacterium]